MKFEVSERQYATIRQAAEIVGVPDSRIRAWRAQGLVPGFFSGTRYYVNVPLFREALERGEIGQQPQGGTGSGRFAAGDYVESGDNTTLARR